MIRPWLLSAFLTSLFLPGACDWRKPLPRRNDAGPPVEVVDARPIGPGASFTNRPGPSRGAGVAADLLEEHEPNDDSDHAQPITLVSGVTKGVRGSLAPPTSQGAGKGADDWYEVSFAPATGPQQLRVELSGSPLADLSLELFDGSAPRGAGPQPFAQVDEHGRGETEHLTLGIHPQKPLLLRVRGSVAGVNPRPDASVYQLLLTQGSAPVGSEIEPNDTPEQATPVTNADLSGTLPWHGDEDFWVLDLVDALYRKPAAGEAKKNLPGLSANAILRIELRTPGATPALRVLVLPATMATEEKAQGDEPSGFRKLKFLLDVLGAKGSQELRLRNVGLAAGSARAFIGVRALSTPVAKGAPAVDPRYQLRLVVEPAMEDAESEPNDDCAQSNLIPLGPPSGGVSEGSLAGFLWPGDIDCFRVHPAAAGPLRHSISLTLPGSGSECRAGLEWVHSDNIQSTPSPGAGNTALNLRGHGDALFRVSSRENKTCFDAPYRLTVRSEPDRP